MFYTIILLAIMGLIGTDLFSPSLPQIAQVFHQNQNYTQLTVSLFLCGFAISQLFYGPISDRVGRKPPLVFGVTTFIIGSLFCVFNFHSFVILCVGRIIQGIGVGAGLSLARVVLRDCYSGIELAIKGSKVAMFVSLTPAVAPFLGGILQQQFGYLSPFIFMLFYGVFLMVLLKTRFHETLQRKETTLTMKDVFVRYGEILKNVFFIRYAVIAGLAFSSIILCANMVPFIVQKQLQLTPIENGSFVLIAALGISFGAFISKCTIKKLSSERLVLIGLSLFTLNGFLLILSDMFFGTHLYFIAPLIFLITIGCGFIFPNALALCFSIIDNNIGIAGSIYGTLQALISMIVNFLLNMITHQGQSVMGMFYLSMGLLGLMLCFMHKANSLFFSRASNLIN